MGLGIICSCLPALNVLTTYTKQRSSSSNGAFRRPKKQPQSSGQIFDGSRPGDPQYHLSRSELSTSARRGSTDSARLIASHEQSGLPVGENSDTIIKMVSLNQHWENASQRLDHTSIASPCSFNITNNLQQRKDRQIRDNVSHIYSIVVIYVIYKSAFQGAPLVRCPILQHERYFPKVSSYFRSYHAIVQIVDKASSGSSPWGSNTHP